MPKKKEYAVVPCSRTDAMRMAVETFADELSAAAPQIGSHGLSEKDFWEAGLFQAAIERLRGQRAASMIEKRKFVAEILDFLREKGLIENFSATGQTDRHDYEVVLPAGMVCAIEAKGCLDGNNSNIYIRPPNADEFVVWSLCQNPGSDPRHNVWSGLHTRLSANIMSEGSLVDGVVIWDGMCGTLGRPCPKLHLSASRAVKVGSRLVPPPCLYLFPRQIPHPRNNPCPPVHRLSEVKFLEVLAQAFGCDDNDITSVHIDASMEGASVARKTRLVRNGEVVRESRPTIVKRATA